MAGSNNTCAGDDNTNRDPFVGYGCQVVDNWKKATNIGADPHPRFAPSRVHT